MSEITEAGVVGAVGKELFIGGKWVGAEGGKTFAVRDPATGKELCQVADASPADGVSALDAAVAAQADFAAMAPRERGEILRRAYELLTARSDELALLMTLEMGKPLAESKGEIAYAAEFFRWFAEEAVRIGGDFATAPNGSGRFLITRQPVGPTILITPWNFPMAMGTRKIGPAIAAGCTMVIKPAAQTPLSMLALAGILAEAGLPEGVVNVLTTSHSGQVMEPLIRDGRARKLSFTGSTEVGRKLLEQCADKILRTSMELGGNAPFVVFDDADLDAAIEGAMLAKMRNIGEACTAANRFYVQRGIAEEFAKRLTERMSALPMGRGTEDGVVVGPLIDEDAVTKVSELVADAVGRGARVLTGGESVGRPRQLLPADRAHRCATGSPAHARGDLRAGRADRAVRHRGRGRRQGANDTEFGLVSYLYTSDLKRALRVCERLEAGMIGLNQGLVSNPAAPFGGIKQSGLGREGGKVGIEEFLEIKYIAVAL